MKRFSEAIQSRILLFDGSMGALLSRMRVFVLKALDAGDLHAALGRTHLGIEAHVADQYNLIYHKFTGF